MQRHGRFIRFHCLAAISLLVCGGAGATPSPTVSLSVSNFRNVITTGGPSHFEDFCLWQMPDQQTPILQDSGGTYWLFLTGWSIRPDQRQVKPPPGSPAGAKKCSLYGPSGSLPQVGTTMGIGNLVKTTDLTDAKQYQWLGPVLQPECNCSNPQTCMELLKGKSVPACGALEGRADYVGFRAVFPVNNDPTFTNLIAFYIADTNLFANDATVYDGSTDQHLFYGQLCIATSGDGGMTWVKQQCRFVTGEPLPTRPGTKGRGGPWGGFNQPAVFMANGYYYAMLDYHPSGQYPPGAPYHGRRLEVARAKVGSNGMPQTWERLYNGKFDRSQVSTTDGSGQGDDIGAAGGMPWVSYNRNLKQYLMTTVQSDGWYYQTLTADQLSTQTWSAPIKFFTTPGKNGSKGQETMWNMSFVSPGLPNEQTGAAGYAVYFDSSSWLSGPYTVTLGVAEFSVSISTGGGSGSGGYDGGVAGCGNNPKLCCSQNGGVWLNGHCQF